MAVHVWRSARSLGVLLLCAVLFLSRCSEPPQSDAETTPEGDHFEETLGGSMIAVEAAGDSLVMGDELFGDEVPQRLERDFEISRTEITRTQYGYFVDDGGYENPIYWTAAGWDWREEHELSRPSYWEIYTEPDHPVVGVSWHEAVAFCSWLSVKAGRQAAYDAGGRLLRDADGYHLPTELQWEYAAARAGEPPGVEREFPYGDGWYPDRVVCAQNAPSSVASRPQGNTPLGIADLAGNAWEWCSDNYGPIEEAQPGREWYHFNRSDDYLVVRGGHWGGTYQFSFRSAARARYLGDTRSKYIGFRVARTRVARSQEEPR
jgi:formylglycine-generating enzyme required for sulfatase activity